jgi:beta-xylosidase
MIPRLLLTTIFSFFATWPVIGETAGGDAWLFTSFRGNGDGLHLAYSPDALDWTDLDRVFLKPEVGAGLMRDPHILRDSDGLYLLVWTSGWKDTGIGYATSKDLVNWSAQKYLPLMESVPGTQFAWAPELYRVSKTGEYLLLWSSAVPFPGEEKPRIRAYYSLTKDFVTFTPPKVFFDPGFDNIDSTLVYSQGKYRLFLKATDDDSTKAWGAMHVAVAENLLGPYQLLPGPALSHEKADGPAPVVLGDLTRLYFDYYSDHRYGVRETRDWKTWTDVTKSAAMVKDQRHGSIFSAPAELVEKLRRDSASVAPPPILGGFTADPAIRVFGDTYYIYPTSDRPYWNTTEFAVWSSKNLVTWKKEGIALDLSKNEVTWADSRAWAPDCIERNGTYYLYFCGAGKIGVATSRSPLGPFKDALGHPLVARGGKIKTNAIDPVAFIDDNGQAYLYYGNGKPCQVVRLKPDMISIDGDPVDINLRDFREGIVVFKRAGKYYFMWSIDDARSPNYRVGWGVADSPYGPVVSPKEKFIVLQKNGTALGTAHHSVVNIPGTDRWYVAFHRHAVPGGGGYKRETCLVRMEFDADGGIKPMDPMKPAFLPGDLGEPLVNGRGKP